MLGKRLLTDKTKFENTTCRGIGAHMETLACAHLREVGYRVIQRNFYCRYGEIDVVAWDGPVLAFIEVRYRKIGSLVSPTESVGKSKMRRIKLTVRHYLGRNRIPDDIRVRVDLCCLQGPAPAPWPETVTLEQLTVRLLKGIAEFS